MTNELNKSPPESWSFNLRGYILDGKGRDICRMSRTISFDSDNEEGIETLAHARMLAAAPELLEVVEAMARFDGRNNNSTLKQMAKEALAKARGQQ